MSMTHRKSILEFSSTVAAIVLIGIATATLPLGTATMNAQAQNADTSQQIKDYLIKAIQALDSGDNSEAMRQLQLATDQMGPLTGVSVQSSVGESGESGQDNNNVDESDDRGEGSEEGQGEDADEPGDTDSTDEEDK
jgi:hypothetical protein